MAYERLEEDIKLMKDAGIRLSGSVNKPEVCLNPGKENLNLPGWIESSMKCMKQG